MGSVFVATFLIAVWVFSAPSAVPEQSGGSAITKQETKNPVEAVEDTPSDVSDNSAAEEGTAKNTEEEGVESLPKEEETLPTVTDDVKEDASVKEDETSPVLDETTKDETPSKEDEGTNIEENVDSKSSLPDSISGQAELGTENKEVNNTKFETQVEESKEEKVVQNGSSSDDEESTSADATPTVDNTLEDGSLNWKLCVFEGAQDYIPCLDNKKVLAKLRSTKHYEHRERHCPTEEELPKCLVPLPKGYRTSIKWPSSRDQIWFNNVPHVSLASYKADQNWVKRSNDKEKLIFPGGGTQFKFEGGALRYIDFVEKEVPDIAWGKRTRVLLDVGCGVASFGGYLFERNVLAMSLAPKDEHEAQVQFALERGIPAISAVMGTQRLVFPSNVFDVVHCARCRVPWHIEGGKLLLELNRVLRPGGFFVWSATPVYWDNEEDVQIWNDTTALTERMGWKLIKRAMNNETQIGIAVFQKPKDNKLYNMRKVDDPPICDADDKPDAAWYVPMKPCLHNIPEGEGVRGTSWPEEWPVRVESTPSWLSATDKGIYGKPAAEDFQADTNHWKHVVSKSYLEGVGINWTSIRNVMDMKAGYGGFAAALVAHPLWVMNIVPVTEPDTLPIIFDRGLIGMYHDWCEPHSTYPRSYDLMHSDHLLSSLTKKCKIVNVVMEMDRILRPDGWAIFREESEVLGQVEDIVKSLHWDVVLSFKKSDQKLLVAQKRFWRPEASSD